MKLTGEQQEMLDGGRGWPQQIAARILVAVGRAHDADGLIPVSSVHLSMSGISMAEPGMRLVETLVERGGRFAVPTSLNVLSMDRRAVGTVPGIGGKEQVQLRIARACERLGGRPTYSCNPFLLGILPARDESVAWNESATAPFINAVLGARTNREGATALASALTGLTANYGMHLQKNRLGTILIQVDAPVLGADAFSVLGGAVGRACDGKVAVIEGIDRRPSTDEMTAFCAAFAAISPASMFHIVGMTPEAPTRDAALARGAARTPVRISAAELASERRRYVTAAGAGVDVIAIGCPHASLEQVREVAEALGGRRVDPKVRFLVQANRDCAEQAGREGIAARLAAAGVTLMADSCVHIAYDEVPPGKTLATNSLKIAYMTASHDVGVHFGTVRECVDAGVAGRWIG